MRLPLGPNVHYAIWRRRPVARVRRRQRGLAARARTNVVLRLFLLNGRDGQVRTGDRVSGIQGERGGNGSEQKGWYYFSAIMIGNVQWPGPRSHGTNGQGRPTASASEGLERVRPKSLSLASAIVSVGGCCRMAGEAPRVYTGQHWREDSTHGYPWAYWAPSRNGIRHQSIP